MQDGVPKDRVASVSNVVKEHDGMGWAWGLLGDAGRGSGFWLGMGCGEWSQVRWDEFVHRFVGGLSSLSFDNQKVRLGCGNGCSKSYFGEKKKNSETNTRSPSINF